MYRFTTKDAERLNEQGAVEAAAAVAEGRGSDWVKEECDRLGVDREAIVALVGPVPELCSAVHLGLHIAEYQRERTLEQVLEEATA